MPKTVCWCPALRAVGREQEDNAPSATAGAATLVHVPQESSVPQEGVLPQEGLLGCVIYDASTSTESLDCPLGVAEEVLECPLAVTVEQAEGEPEISAGVDGRGLSVDSSAAAGSDVGAAAWSRGDGLSEGLAQEAQGEEEGVGRVQHVAEGEAGRGVVSRRRGAIRQSLVGLFYGPAGF